MVLLLMIFTSAIMCTCELDWRKSGNGHMDSSKRMILQRALGDAGDASLPPGCCGITRESHHYIF